ncbi:MAG: glycoside hydrolase family 127 protein, partial [Prevotella sp.]|nr:glycoside hydrolase family 127 protein [Prevotella sp.]
MKKESTIKLLVIICLTFIGIPTKAQNILYPQHFALSDVTLLDSPFKTAMDRNINQLFLYDTNRLLTPFVRQAGLSETSDSASRYYNWEMLHPNFENWTDYPSFALDGHEGGHYLSALSLAYAACHDNAIKDSLLNKINYIVNILNDCQRAFDNNTEGLKGYIGGLPDNSIWTDLYNGSNAQLNERWAWVPFYVIHKIFAGLRDAYIYTGNNTAFDMLKGMGDWAINVVSKIDECDMDTLVLANEHGGMNEVLADLYSLTNDDRYLAAAKKYSHKKMLNGMQTLNTTFLDYKHSNTQVPKYIGFERISQVDPSASEYYTAAINYWTDMVDNRTIAIGGNSVDEHLFPQSKNSNYINNSNGPETCNTYNMLKLTENLFDDFHDAKYADFYEKAMLNHILSTQDPITGGYVYFTPLRPQSYRVYSVANKAMWCCVGSGMENHSKYGDFIYTHSTDNSTLWINLFTASKLDNDIFSLTQETAFPYGDTSIITVNKSGNYTIAVRHPAWTTDDYKVTVNGNDVTGNVTKGVASYVYLDKEWQTGDVITVTFPMELSLEPLPDCDDYVAIKYGPTVLAARTSSNNPDDFNYDALPAQYAGIGRMDHAPGTVTDSLSLSSAPMLIGERDNILKQRIIDSNPKELSFTLDVSHEGSEWTTLELIPFYKAQNARYMVYWKQLTEEEYAKSH